LVVKVAKVQLTEEEGVRSSFAEARQVSGIREKNRRRVAA
jgi:hypothetical protein